MSQKAHKIYKTVHICVCIALYLALTATLFLAPYKAYVSSQGGDIKLGYAIYFLLYSLLIIPYYPCIFGFTSFVRTLIERIGRVDYNGTLGTVILALRSLCAAFSISVTVYFACMMCGANLSRATEDLFQAYAMLIAPSIIIMLSIAAFVLHIILKKRNKIQSRIEEAV